MEFPSFVIELTADGSPTLRLKNSNHQLQEKEPESRPESMHHSGGAASETLYIYTKPFKNSLTAVTELKLKDFSIGVVGLGLGYIELSFIQHLKDQPSFSTSLLSFEKKTELIEKITAWLKGKNNSTYELICEKLGVEKEQILERIQNLDWKKRGLLNFETQVSKPFNFVAYDAFSQATDGPLWTDDFLDFFLTNLCGKDCVFSTYACTGILKRALQRNGFLFIKRHGFNGKRDATLALRGQFKSLQNLFQSV